MVNEEAFQTAMKSWNDKFCNGHTYAFCLHAAIEAYEAAIAAMPVQDNDLLKKYELLWNPICEHLRKNPKVIGLKLGENIPEKLLKYLKKLSTQTAASEYCAIQWKLISDGKAPDGEALLVYPSLHETVTVGHCHAGEWWDALDENAEIEPVYWAFMPSEPAQQAGE